jgi:hypothetical protein
MHQKQWNKRHRAKQTVETEDCSNYLHQGIVKLNDYKFIFKIIIEVILLV